MPDGCDPQGITAEPPERRWRQTIANRNRGTLPAHPPRYRCRHRRRERAVPLLLRVRS